MESLSDQEKGIKRPEWLVLLQIVAGDKRLFFGDNSRDSSG